jgi:hypothetical protein
MLLKGKKKIKDTMTLLHLSGRALPNWGLHPEFATIVDRKGTSSENAQKEDSPGGSPAPSWDPALSTKVTTGGVSAPVSRWKGGVPPPMDYWVLGPPVQAPLLSINVEESWLAIMAEK